MYDQKFVALILKTPDAKYTHVVVNKQARTTATTAAATATIATTVNMASSSHTFFADYEHLGLVASDQFKKEEEEEEE